ncbi:uncharacterized protein PV07_12861, partial [Cladophialophora immunda]
SPASSPPSRTYVPESSRYHPAPIRESPGTTREAGEAHNRRMWGHDARRSGTLRHSSTQGDGNSGRSRQGGAGGRVTHRLLRRPPVGRRLGFIRKLLFRIVGRRDPKEFNSHHS